MDTRDAQVIDAFAPAPHAGTPVGLVLDETGLAPDQTVRLAGELGQWSTAVLDPDTQPPALRAAEPATADLGPHAAVAAAHALSERGHFDGDDGTLVEPRGTREISVDADSVAWVDVDAPECRPAEATEAELAGALGLDPAALRDVAADLPPTRASIGPAVLAVPVNFLEHLGRIEPDTDELAAVLEAASVDALYAFTFDTLNADRDVHGLELDRTGRRRPPTGAAEACAAAVIERFGGLEADRETIGFEAGDRFDRPARLAVRLGDPYAVGGSCTTALEGSIAVPPATSDDEIVEA